MLRLTLLLLIFAASSSLFAAETMLINRSDDGSISSSAVSPALSADGSIIVYASDATDLYPAFLGNDTNGAFDIFATHTQTGVTELISLNVLGIPGDADSKRPSISADGRYVVFESEASNLISGVVATGIQIYLHDRTLNDTRLISRAVTLDPGNGNSSDASISANGEFVVFTSAASDLVFSDTNGLRDVFVMELSTGAITRVSVTSTGTEATGSSMAGVISDDGRYVAFHSFSNILVPNDDNGVVDVFRHDLQTGLTVQVSKVTFTITLPFQDPVSFDVTGNGASSMPSMNSDGRLIAFRTTAPNLHGQPDGEHIVVRDMNDTSGFAELITQSSTGMPVDAQKGFPSMSDNGRYVFFEARSDDFDNTDSNDWFDAFLMDRNTGHIERVSVSNDNEQGQTVNLGTLENGGGQRRVTDDGQYVAFTTNHRFLVADDSNSERDVFIRDRGEECPETLPGATRTLAEGVWLLGALPCNPPINRNTVGDLIADDIDGTLGTDWAVFTYNDGGAVPGYITATLQTPLSSGQGFWIQQFSGGTVTLDLPEGSRQATSRTTQPAQACVSADGCYVLPLTGEENDDFRWNLIGNPWAANSSVAFNDLRVRDILGVCSALSGCTMAEAAQPGVNIVFNRFFHHNSSGYVTREAGSNLGAWEGYWAAELSGSESAAPVILFPR